MFVFPAGVAAAGAALALALALVLAGCSAGADHKGDATITACTPAADGGKPVAEGQVTNPTSKGSTYSIRVSFYDASGNKVTEGIDAVTGVEPATSSPWRVTGLQSVSGPVDCRLGKVTRNVQPGQ
jgi:hypothetical protein